MILEEYNEELHIQSEKEISFDEGKKQGIEQGVQVTIFSLVSKGTLTANQAAEELGVSVTELEKKMAEAGYHIPESV